jgi:hypothetical protein
MRTKATEAIYPEYSICAMCHAVNLCNSCRRARVKETGYAVDLSRVVSEGMHTFSGGNL